MGCIAAGITVVAGGFEAISGAFDSPWYFLIVVLVRSNNLALGLGLPIFLF
jgi:hypothetical protein